MVDYACYFTESFQKQLKKLTKKDKKLRNRIEDKIIDLSTHPKHNTDVLLGHPALGKRKIRIGQYRMVFKICIECRENGYDTEENCIDCTKRDDNSLVFFLIDKRKKIYNDVW